MLTLAACSGQVSAGGSPDLPSSADAAEVHLGIGDRISVNVFGVERIGGTFSVGPDGSIDLPLVGAVQAQGQTASELGTAIEDRLRRGGIVENPQVTIGVIEMRPYYIYGEVKSPGKYAYLPGTNILSAIATASGFTYRASENHAFIRRGGVAGEIEVNLADPSAVPVPIYPGDIIRVPDRIF